MTDGDPVELKANGGRVAPAWPLSRAREFGRRMLDAVMPPRCLRCGVIVADPRALCADCFEATTFITPPFCTRCGIPFVDAYASALDNLVCGACLDHPPEFDQTRAVFLYDENSRSLVTRFKYADRTDFSPALARWMVRAGASILDHADLILPVPLHRWRLFNRTYNQSALLSRHITHLSGVPAVFDVLRRAKATPRQGGLSARARRRNVSRAFKVTKPHIVETKRVVLIDDVLTTGATLNACAKVLKSNGAVSVDALVISRVPAPGG